MFFFEEEEIVIDNIGKKMLFIINTQTKDNLFVIKEAKKKYDTYEYKFNNNKFNFKVGEIEVNIDFGLRKETLNELINFETSPEVYLFFYYNDVLNGVTIITKKAL